MRNDRPVVVYGDWVNEWGEEGRLFWMLEYLNHTRVHVLYGGVEVRARPGPVAALRHRAFARSTHVDRGSGFETTARPNPGRSGRPSRRTARAGR